MRCPPINLGSVVVIQKKRSMWHYSNSNHIKKINIRKKIINKRKLFHKQNLNKGDSIAINLMKYIESQELPIKNYKIALYWPMGSEIDTKPSIASLSQFTNNILIASTENNQIKFRKWKPNITIESNKLGVLLKTKEFVKPDIVICPLIAFDKFCNRLGRGGGYYDKKLYNLEKVIKIGFAYSIQEVKKVPTDTNDIKMNAIITEKYIYNY